MLHHPALQTCTNEYTNVLWSPGVRTFGSWKLLLSQVGASHARQVELITLSGPSSLGSVDCVFQEVVLSLVALCNSCWEDRDLTAGSAATSAFCIADAARSGRSFAYNS